MEGQSKGGICFIHLLNILEHGSTQVESFVGALRFDVLVGLLLACSILGSSSLLHRMLVFLLLK